MKRFMPSLDLIRMALGILLPAGSLTASFQPRGGPALSLKDMKGQVYTTCHDEGSAVILLYFFDVESRPSQEGLLSLNRLAGQHAGADLTVWAITLSPQNKVVSVHSLKAASPSRTPGSSRGERCIPGPGCPTHVCTLGPGLKVMDYFQGGGRTRDDAGAPGGKGTAAANRPAWPAPSAMKRSRRTPRI